MGDPAGGTKHQMSDAEIEAIVDRIMERLYAEAGKSLVKGVAVAGSLMFTAAVSYLAARGYIGSHK